MRKKAERLNQYLKSNPMDSFNNYKNKPTWTIALWLQNDETLYSYWTKRAEELPRRELVKELKLQIEDTDNPLTEKATVYSDLLNYSLALVDWDEIADILREEDK